MDDQVQNLVEKVWAKFLVTPPERRLSESISEVCCPLGTERRAFFQESKIIYKESISNVKGMRMKLGLRMHDSTRPRTPVQH